MKLIRLLFLASLVASAGAQTLIDDSIGAVGTAGAGFFHAVNQSATPATPTAAARLYSTAANLPAWVDASGNVRLISGSASALTSGRVPFVTTGGILTDASTFTVSSGVLRAVGYTVDVNDSGMSLFATNTLGFATAGVHTLALTGAASAALTGGAGSMTITAGTGNSRTLTLQTTTSGGTATNALVLGADQSAKFIDGTAGLYLGGTAGANQARIYTSANAANANLILAPDGSGWTQILGTQTIKFGVTALANIGVSADATTAALNFNAPSGGYLNLGSKLYSGYPGRLSNIVFAVTPQPETTGTQGIGTTAYRFGASYFSGPLYIGAASGTSPTISATGAASPNETITVTGAGTGGMSLALGAGPLAVPVTVTAGGTTGAQTINKISGTVNFAGGATSLVVTNSTVTANSIVMAVVRTNDATATIKNVVPDSGSFTITITAAATGETSVGFFVLN